MILSQLPYELLMLVVITVAMDADADARDLRTLCSICKTLRTVALQTPRIWARVIIDTRSRRFLRTVSDVRWWLERSGSCAKDVSLNCLSMSLDHVYEILLLLLAHRPQLRLLHVSGTSRAESILIGPMPLLESFDFPQPSVDTWSALTSGSPCLTRVAVTSGGLWVIPLALRSRITVMSLSRSTAAADVGRLLYSSDRLPALQTLSIAHLELGGPLVASDAASPLRALLVRVLVPDDPTAWTQFFQAFPTPCLETLALSAKGSGNPAPHVLGTLQLLDPVPMLRKLHLCGSLLLRDTDIIPLLRLMPALESLVLLRIKAPGRMLCTALSGPQTHNGAAAWLCPQLVDLYLAVENPNFAQRTSRADVAALERARAAEPTVLSFNRLRLDWSSYKPNEGWVFDTAEEQSAYRWSEKGAPATEVDVFTDASKRMTRQWWQIGVEHALL